jgi:hypothetical protein
VLLFAGCSKGPSADLKYIKQARSVAAEWALVNEQAKSGTVTATYANSMHRWLSESLRLSSSSLAQPNSTYGAEMQALVAEPANAAPERLRIHVRALKRIEDQLESA